jgi:membrane fusion protein, multidrug efflux system
VHLNHDTLILKSIFFILAIISMAPKNLVRILAAFLIGLLCFCQSKPQAPSATSARQSSQGTVIEGYVVKPGVVDRSISISGTLKPFEETVLMPEVTGRVVSINLPEGKSVNQGALLVKLFDGDLQAQLKKTQAQLQIAQQTQTRLSELIKVNGISQSDYDQAVLQVNSISADIEVLRVQIRKTEVRAPFDGVIGLRNISLGAEVTPTTALATIRAVQQLKLDFSVPEKYSREVQQGLKVTFTVENDATAYEATVLATEQGIEAATRNLKARAIVAGKGIQVKPGAFANITLNLGEIKNALMIPTQAIIPQESNKRVIVAKGGKAKFLVVKTGVRQASLIEVTEGLLPGDTVATTGLLFIKPGADLKFSRVLQ